MRVAQDLFTGQTFRLKITTLTVWWSQGKGQARYIPAGALLMQPRIPEANSPFVEVLWKSEPHQMFAQDFKDRTQLVLFDSL